MLGAVVGGSFSAWQPTAIFFLSSLHVSSADWWGMIRGFYGALRRLNRPASNDSPAVRYCRLRTLPRPSERWAAARSAALRGEKRQPVTQVVWAEDGGTQEIARNGPALRHAEECGGWRCTKGWARRNPAQKAKQDRLGRVLIFAGRVLRTSRWWSSRGINHCCIWASGGFGFRRIGLHESRGYWGI